MHAAVVQGFHDVAEILLESHADVNTPCTLLGTPLAAIMTQSWKDFRDICHRRCAKLLLEWGADIDSFDERLGTPMEETVRGRSCCLRGEHWSLKIMMYPIRRLDWELVTKVSGMVHIWHRSFYPYLATWKRWPNRYHLVLHVSCE